MSNTVVPPAEIQDTSLAVQALDSLRVLLQLRITRHMLNELMSYDKVPYNISVVPINELKGKLTLMEREIKEKVPPTTQGDWLEKDPGKEKYLDVVALTETLLRVGMEEKNNTYEEFLGLLTGCIDAVFYAQTHRKNIHFGKYKALFELIKNELHLDTHNLPCQVNYRNGELWIRTVPPIHKTEIE